MTSFPADLRFVHPWRTYQQRVLDDLAEHTSDAHLHVVAAPGAGKTVLGLEVVRRLNRKTLVLAPSLTVRNQWIHHFQELFVTAEEGKDALVSNSLNEPALMTVATYQSLHSAAKNREEGISDFTDFELLVLDEAHHLRNEWWKVLVELKEQLTDVRTVSLTATPPYDVPAREWNRYFEMCGPIDSIVSVPELVREGNLCPHQDFVYFCRPSEEEERTIRLFRRQVEELKEWLLGSDEFPRALLGHPWVSNFDSEQHQADILDQPQVFASHVIFLTALGFDCEPQRKFLGVGKRRVPAPSNEWFEIVLTDLMNDEDERYDATKAFRKELRARLKTMHAMERRRVSLAENSSLDKSLRNSESKLQNSLRIFELENGNLGEDLRMVILTDYVRKEFLESHQHRVKSRRLGAVPIFESIREKYGKSVPLALLTGSLVVLPAALSERLEEAMRRRDPDVRAPRCVPMLADSDYVVLNLDDATRQVIVGSVTELFNRGHIRTIVGTVALLGEGWNAPATNTLLMASASSTYVQTNQVRGRAIRIHADAPRKVSSIWHLVCIEPDSYDGGSDFQKLKRRFSAFEGLSNTRDQILSGLQRLFPIPRRWTGDVLDELNERSTELSAEREDIHARWERALVPPATAHRHGLIEEVSVGNRSIVTLNVVRHPRGRTAEVVGALAGYSAFAAVSFPLHAIFAPQALILHGVALAVFGASFRWDRLLKDWWQVMRIGMGPVALGRVSEVLLDTLCELGIVKTPRDQLELHYGPLGEEQGVAYVHGCSLYESDVFIRSLEELLDAVDNPRYLIFRKSRNPRKARKGEGDYFTVPTSLNTKDKVEVLLRHWNKKIGRCEAIYTRTPEGRKRLLKARVTAWVNQRQRISERKSVWK